MSVLSQRTPSQRIGRRRVTRIVSTLLGCATFVALGVTTADAAWITQGNGGAGAAGGTIGAADAPSASVAGDTVTLTWTPVQLLGTLLQTDRATVVGFEVDGEDEIGPVSLGAACTDTTATSCTHTQPEGTTWRYAVVAGLGGWTGPQGVRSAPATVTPRPTSSVTFPGGGWVNAAGWNGACSAGAGVCGTATPDTDDGAAITRVEVRITDPDGRALDAGGDWVVDDEAAEWRTVLDRTPAAAGSPAPYDWFLALPASALTGPDGTYTVAVRVGDAAGWTAVPGTSGSVGVDRVAPVTTSDAPSGTQDAPVTITFAATDSGGSGVAKTEYRISTDGGTSFTAWTTGTSVTLDESATYTVEFRSTDVAGNVESAKTATVTVFIDLSPPTVTLTAPADATTVLSRDAVTLSATASHPTFAIVSVQFEWSRDSGVSWTAIGDPVTTPVAGVYSVTTTSPHLPAGALQLRATATHTGGISGYSSTRSITVRPEIVSLTLENGNGTAEQGDQVVITFTDALDPSTVCSSFTASSSPQSHSDLTVRIAGNNPQTLTITATGSCGTSGFGTLNLPSGRNRYTNQSLVFANSTITWDPDAKQLRLTLGTSSGNANTNRAAHDVTYTPGALRAGTVGLPAGTFTATGQRF